MWNTWRDPLYASKMSRDSGRVSRAGATSHDALTHVLDNVLCLPATSGLRQSLQAAGYTKIVQVFSMSRTTMESLSYKVKVAGVVSNKGLLLGELDTLTALQRFARFKQAQLGGPVPSQYWLQVTKDEFASFRRMTYPSVRRYEFTGSHSTGKRLGRPLARYQPHVHKSDVYPDCNMGSHHDSVDGHMQDSYLDFNMGSDDDDGVEYPDTLSDGHMCDLYPDFNMGSDDDCVEYPNTS